MSETKRYYWLKLPENFFDATDDETISFIEEQEGGSAYVLFYLKLLCKALRTDGTLIRLIGNRYVPYDEKSLSKLTNTPVDTVRCAVAILKEVGLLKQLDSGELYLTQINEFVGSETNKAVAMRKTRAKNRLEGNNVTPALPDCYPDVTQSKRKSIEKEEREEELEKELEEDISASDDARSVSSDVNQCKTNVRPNVNTNGKWTINDTLSVVEESNLSEPLKEKVCDWIQYKREEKRFTYKERSSKALVHEVEKAEQTYGSIAVIEQIGKAMSSGWQGMNLNLIETKKPVNNTASGDNSAAAAFERLKQKGYFS